MTSTQEQEMMSSLQKRVTSELMGKLASNWWKRRDELTEMLSMILAAAMQGDNEVTVETHVEHDTLRELTDRGFKVSVSHRGIDAFRDYTVVTW